MNKRIPVVCLSAAIVIISAVVGACSEKVAVIKKDAYPITILTSASAGNSVTPDSPVKQKVEELTNTKLDIDFVPSEAYSEKLNEILASGKLPMILYIRENTPSVISAIRRGEFWDVTDYLPEYKYLSKANQIILDNMSVDGRVYGLYRKRDLGRNGYAYRKDWLNNLGMTEPTTVVEFYNMLTAFTMNDPDGNGKNDTYGMTVTNIDTTFNIFATWNGAPNGWGFDENDNLVPAHLTDEYFETVKLFKQMAEDGLINSNFVVMDAENWNEPFANGKSGVILDTCDRAVKLDSMLKENGINGEVGVGGVVNGRAQPHLGYSGYFAFPKSAVRDEETLKRLLQFMDDCCKGEITDLMGYGIEGRHYDLVDGFIQQRTGTDVPRNEINDFNQVLTFIDKSEAKKVVQTDIQKEAERVMENNELYSVANPAQSLVSETYLTKGTQLDKIVVDARIKYMSGQFDDEEYIAEMQRWRENGGDDVIREINEAYKTAMENKNK